MNYKEILKQLQEYYSRLLIIQYNGKKKAKATIELMANLIWSNMALMQIRDAFDWKTAKGVQLDIIGKWVGVSRAYNENNTWSNTYLSYPSYGTDTIAEADSQRGGYSTYADFDTLDGGVLTYKDLQNNKQQLGDEDYRTVIGLKIIKNSIVHNQGNIDDAIFNYFNSDRYENLNNWQKISQIKNANDFWAFAYGNGLYVAINTSGEIYSSADSETWSKIAEDITYATPNSLTFCNNQFIIFTNSGIYVSTDGETWTQKTTSYLGNKITFNGENYLLLATDKIYFLNSDFDVINFVDLSNNNFISWYTLNNGNGIYVATGAAGTKYYAITSKDGINWSDPVYIFEETQFVFQNCIFTGSDFILIDGNVYASYSKDGINWSEPRKIYNATSSISAIISDGNTIKIIDYKSNIYNCDFVSVYTTWQPHIITYHYPTKMTTVMNICKYKNVLLAPTGVSIQLASY